MLRILVAHSNDRILRRIRTLFPARYALEGVNNATELEQALRSPAQFTPPDLLLLDPQLAGLDVMAFLRKSREDALMRAVPVVLIADPAHLDLCCRALRVGADDYVLTTYDDDELSVRVSARLRGRCCQPADEAGCPAGQMDECEVAQERGRLLREVEQGRALLDAVLHQMPAGVVIVEAPSGRVLMGNEQMESILRHPILDTPDVHAYGKWRGYHLDGRPYEAEEWPLTRSIRTGEVVQGEHVEFERGDGTRAIVAVSSAPIRDAAGHIVAGVAVNQDITEQALTQNLLQKSEAHFRHLAESSTSGLFTADLDGRVLYLNPTMARLLGFTPDDVEAGRVNWSDLTAPEYAALDAEAVRQIRQTGVCTPYEKEFISRSGRRVPVLIGGAMLGHTGDGQEVAAAFVTDLTSVKETEEALRQSERRLREVLENSRDAIYELDLVAGRYTYGSPSNRDVIGFGPDELIAMGPEGVRDRIHPDDYDLYMDDLESLISSSEQQPKGIIEYRWMASDGRYHWLSNSRTLVRDMQGRPLKIVGVARDVTERREAEDALRQSEARFRTVLDNSHDVIYQYNLADDYYEYISPSVERTMNVKLGDTAGIKREHVLRRVHPDDRESLRQASEAMSSDLAGKRGNMIEFRWRMGDDTYRWFGLSRRLVTDHAGHPQREVGIVRDITRQKEEAQQILRLNEVLEQRVAERTAVAERRAEQLRALAAELAQAEQRERRRIAQTLHDDLQQLIAGAKLYLGLARGGTEDARLNQLLGQVDHLLEQAVDSSRTLTMELSPPVLHEGSLADALHWLSRWMQQTHGLDVEVQIEQDIDPVADEVCLFVFQSVRELLFNIVKHAGVSWAGLSVARLEDDRIRVVVSDAGRGFDPDHSISADDMRGGFGLFSVRERVEWLGGQVQIESHADRGTRATIHVPADPGTLAQARAVVAVTTDNEPLPQADRESTAEDCGVERSDSVVRLLVVDDHRMLRDGLLALLNPLDDMQVVGQASDGEEAIDAATRLRPDVILMDVSMPRMSGLEATRQIAGLMPEVAIIALSMHEQHMATPMLSAGAVAYLTKGGPADDLIATIRRYARNTHCPDESSDAEP